MKKFIIILIVILLTSCNKTTTKNEAIIEDSTIIKNQPIASTSDLAKLSFIDKEFEEDLKKAIINGDTLAYQKCYKQYVINGYDKEFLYYAIIMAEKNNYKRAYYDISRILALRTEDPLVTKNNFLSSFGAYSFLKSYELGDKFAKDEVKDFYINENKPIPKSSSIYCK